MYGDLRSSSKFVMASHHRMDSGAAAMYGDVSRQGEVSEDEEDYHAESPPLGMMYPPSSGNSSRPHGSMRY